MIEEVRREFDDLLFNETHQYARLQMAEISRRLARFNDTITPMYGSDPFEDAVYPPDPTP